MIPYAVCRNLEEIFEQGNPPADEDDADKAKVLKPVHLFELQMAVPRKGHKRIGKDEKQYRINSTLHKKMNCLY